MNKAILFLFVIFLFSNVVEACPFCTIVFSSAAFSANYFGLDLIVFGLFIGATIIPSGHFINSFIKKEYFKFQNGFISFILFLITIFIILIFDPGGNIYYRINFILKLLIGSFIGVLITVLAFMLNKFIKLKIKFKKTIVSFIFLIITGVILQLIFRNDILLDLSFYLGSKFFFLISS